MKAMTFPAAILATIKLLAFVVLPWGTASAQDMFIQIEAHPDLPTARERVRIFAGYLNDVGGFQIGSRWYGIALGPYDRQTAGRRLEALRQLGMVPDDSYLVDRNTYSRQFYPIDTIGVTEPETVPDGTDPGTTSPSPAVSGHQAQASPLESRRQALRSELLLTPDQKLELQRALHHLGFYQGSLDSVFGRGTRRAMAAWQASKGYTPTNVLTTRQREELISEHQAMLTSLGLRNLRDEVAGIEIEIPETMVTFDRYEPPFAYYGAVDGSGVAVVLISQSGDKITLQALHEILLRTVAVAPPDATPGRTSNRFTISGTSGSGRTFVHAALIDDAIKGFILVWPEREDAHYEIVLEAMRESFTPISGIVLADFHESVIPAMSIDLANDLDPRQPRDSRSGFYIDGEGTVLTAYGAVKDCGHITIDGSHGATVVAGDGSAELALLAPTEPLVPPDYARGQTDTPRMGSKVAVSGYSFGGKLGAPTLTYGSVEELKGLGGERTVTRLAVAANRGDVGGPVLDTTGALLGLLLPEESGSGRFLPPKVRFAVNTAAISKFLEHSGYVIEESSHDAHVPPQKMAEMATGMTVLVNCWEE